MWIWETLDLSTLQTILEHSWIWEPWTMNDSLASGRCLPHLWFKTFGVHTTSAEIFCFNEETKTRTSLEKQISQSRVSGTGQMWIQAYPHSNVAWEFFLVLFYARNLGPLAEVELTSVVLLPTPSMPACSAGHQVLAWSIEGWFIILQSKYSSSEKKAKW